MNNDVILSTECGTTELRVSKTDHNKGPFVNTNMPGNIPFGAHGNHR